MSKMPYILLATFIRRWDPTSFNIRSFEEATYVKPFTSSETLYSLMLCDCIKRDGGRPIEAPRVRSNEGIFLPAIGRLTGQ